MDLANMSNSTTPLLKRFLYLGGDYKIALRTIVDCLIQMDARGIFRDRREPRVIKMVKSVQT